ncbi:hypothetical protein PoB_005374300 [Plakobranchus ocellatus]|uniref:Uncharacterized protein n=1 Tax=Plakobranchus ocellatus TaxID=259542 RepID=A0AAV4C8B0_9GAST|nr:hypothetical protein PoB_005374300 [Plakobranchus ocellatus]
MDNRSWQQQQEEALHLSTCPTNLNAAFFRLVTEKNMKVLDSKVKFSGLGQAKAPVAGLEFGTEESLQILGRIRYPEAPQLQKEIVMSDKRLIITVRTS